MKRGQRFGRLVVIDANAGTRDKTHKRQVTLRCDCGTEYVAAIYSLVDGATKSCGCLRRDRWSQSRLSPKRVENLRAALKGQPKSETFLAAITTHGLSGHPLYPVWIKMMKRCHDQDDRAYRNYGARGIAVCDSWHDVRNYIAWVDANLGPRPGGLTPKGWPEFTLDRIDNAGNYEPGNLQWADWHQQRTNQRPRIGSLKEFVEVPDDTTMECGTCGEVTTSLSAFDKHRRRVHP